LLRDVGSLSSEFILLRSLLHLYVDLPNARAAYCILGLFVHLQVKDTQQLLDLNKLRQGFCDVTVAEVNGGQINPLLVRETGRHFFRVVVGNRYRLKYTQDDPASVYVETIDTYSPPRSFTGFVFGAVNRTTLALKICQIMETSCPSVMEANDFQNQAECAAQMADLPLLTTNKDGIEVLDGNSTGCRHLHATLAARSPELHCEHISFMPMEDSQGKVKCSETMNLDQHDYFTAENFNLFVTSAFKHDLDPVSQFEDLDQKPDCATSFDVDAITSARMLPKAFACWSILESQKATGKNNTIYWGALVGFWVLFVGLGMHFLRRKALTI